MTQQKRRPDGCKAIRGQLLLRHKLRLGSPRLGPLGEGVWRDTRNTQWTQVSTLMMCLKLHKGLFLSKVYVRTMLWSTLSATDNKTEFNINIFAKCCIFGATQLATVFSNFRVSLYDEWNPSLIGVSTRHRDQFRKCIWTERSACKGAVSARGLTACTIAWPMPAIFVCVSLLANNVFNKVKRFWNVVKSCLKS